MSNILPQDGYDTFITAPLTSAATEVFVNVLPTQTVGFLTIFDIDGRTIKEKIKYTGVSSSPNKLTGLVRRLTQVPVGQTVPDTAGITAAVDHPSNVRIAMTDNIHYLGKVLSQLEGSTVLEGVPQLPAVRVIDNSRRVVDKEYADSLVGAGTVAQFLVTKNGADPTLTVNIATGRWIKDDKTVNLYAGEAAKAVNANQTNYIELNPSTNLSSVNTVGFTAGSLPLAIAVTNGTTITSLTDWRGFFTLNAGAVDVIRTWATVQSFPADNLQITTDPDTANDATRKSYVDGKNYGDASDGVLNVLSGTTTLTNNKVYQYSSINIAVGATLTVGGAANRNILRILCQGDCNIAGTILLTGCGQAGSAGGATGGAVGTAGSAGFGVGGAGAGGGGGSGQNVATGNGNNGSAASGSTGGAGGTSGGGQSGVGGAGGAAATFNGLLPRDSVKFGLFVVALGAGGGGGGGGRDNGNNDQTGQTGGDGGGALVLEVGGNMTITGTLSCNGAVPSTGGTSRAGGGGGGGGTVYASCAGTYTSGGTTNVSGAAGSVGTGSGGFKAGDGGAGSNGASLIGKNVVIS